MLWFFLLKLKDLLNLQDFNTSNVMVLQPKYDFAKKKWIFQYIQCYGSSFPCLCQETCYIRFQYIQCYGSSLSQCLLLLLHHNFNTSNVMVLRSTSIYAYLIYFNFNTSNVMVLPAILKLPIATGVAFQYIQCYGSSY